MKLSTFTLVDAASLRSLADTVSFVSIMYGVLTSLTCMRSGMFLACTALASLVIASS